MKETALVRARTGSGSVPRLAVVSLVAAVAFAFAAADSSAQAIIPKAGPNDYCSDSSPAGLTAYPLKTAVKVTAVGRRRCAGEDVRHPGGGVLRRDDESDLYVVHLHLARHAGV